ncbi:hypothetical protein ABPG74_005230 [Tetrahymena malaccensis]
MQKQADQESQNQEQQYDPHKTPADLDMAKKHLKAKAVGQVRNIELINTSEICPCCGCIIEKEKVSLLCKLEDLGFLGAGVSLYFFFIKYCIAFLFFIGLICSIFNILRNISGSNCSAIPQCQTGFINNLSIINRNDPNGQFQTQAGLNFLTTITLIVASVILRKKMSTMSKQINVDNITAGDFTVMVTNLKIGTTEQQLVDYIKSWTKRYGEIQIVKVNFAYDISNYIKIKRQHQELVLKQIKEKASLKEKQQENSHLLSKLSQEIDELEKQIANTEENFKTGNFVRSGTAFVTFGSDNTAELVTSIFKRGLLNRIFVRITRYGSLNGNIVTIKRAPEPNDIYWENLCYSYFEKLTSNLITHFFTAVLLVAAFFIIFAISKAQDNIQSTSNKNDPIVIFLSFIASLFIFIINNGLNMIIRKFAIFEKHATLTHYFIGVAQKSGIAQFLNTTIVVYIIKKIKLESQIYISGGLLYTIHFILLMNLVGSFNIFMNPFYFYKLWQRRKAEKGDKQFIEHTPQQKMNEIYEGPKFDFPAAYAKIIKLIMFASYYSYPAPLIVYVSLGILILTYWFDKYHLLSRCSTPDYLSHHLPEAMADFYLEFMIVVFCIGNIVFENLLFDKSSGLTVAALVIAILFWVADFDAIVTCLCSNDNNQTQVRRYEYYSQYFLTDYERSNPVTAMKAIEEWTKKLQDSKNKEINKKQNLMFLSNYALNRPGISSFYQQGFRQQQMNMNMMNQQQYQPQQFGMNFNLPQQFMPNQYRPQQQYGGFPHNYSQVIPMRQPQIVTDPAMMQSEINSLKQQQEQLRQQMLNNFNPMFQLNVISQLERNSQRINYLESLINRQQPVNIAPAIGFQGNLPNPLQDPSRQSNFIMPQQNNLPNPLIVNQTNQSQINTQQSNQNNNQVTPNQLSSSYTNMQPQQIQSNSQNPMLYPQQPNQQIIQPQQQAYRNPNQQGSMIQQPFNINYQQQQQQQYMSNPQGANVQFQQQQQAQQPVFQQNYYNQRPGFIPMMMPQQQQQQQPFLQQGANYQQQYK